MLKWTEKKGSDWIIKIISQTSCWNVIVLRLKTLVGKQNKKVRDWRCYYPDSPISTFITLANSNFSFGKVECLNTHCFFIIYGIYFFSSPSLSLLLLLSSVYIFRLFIYSFVSIIRIITIVTISIHFFPFIYSFNFFP